MGQGATGEPNCWGEGGRRGEHKKKPIVAQGATGEHKEKPGWGIRKSHVSIRKSPVRIRKSPVRIRAETVSIRKSREHKGRDPQHKKKYHAQKNHPPPQQQPTTTNLPCSISNKQNPSPRLPTAKTTSTAKSQSYKVERMQKVS